MKLAVFAVLLVIVPFQAEAGSCIGKDTKVWVSYGKDLTGDGRQKPDPYVVVKIGDVTKRTDVKKNTVNPSWQEKLLFKNVSSNKIIITVFDSDKATGRKDDLLGTCIKKLVPGKKISFRHIKCDMDDKKGFVSVYYKCV